MTITQQTHDPASEHQADDLAPLELSIVMPCLNESLTVADCVKQAVQALEDHQINGEVIVADNGSTDGSQALAEEHGARVVHVKDRGYGAALAGGIAAARGRYVVMGDCDKSYDFSHAPRILEKLHEGYDLVMGNRFRGGIAPGAMPVLHRYLGNPGLTRLGRLFFRAPVGDFYCGLRGFDRAKILDLNLRSTGMEFALEMVAKSSITGLRMGEVPTTLSPDGRDRAPHLRTWRDGWRSLRFFLLFSPKWLFLYPGIAAGLLGALVFAVGLLNFNLLGVRFENNTMLFGSLAMLLGVQSVFFALLAKTFATTTGIMPPDARLQRFYQRFALEKGVLIGGIALTLGLLGLIIAIGQWAVAGFGDLQPSVTRYWVIPGFTFLALGFQTILSSFLVSALGMERK